MLLTIGIIAIYVYERNALNIDGTLFLFIIAQILLFLAKGKIRTNLYLCLSMSLLMCVNHLGYLKELIDNKNASMVLNVAFIEFGIIVKGLSLLLSLVCLKNAIKKLYGDIKLSTLLSSSILTIYIIKANFSISDFPFVLVGNLEFELFSRAFSSYVTVCMHYISIYLLVNLYVFAGKRPRQFLNQL
jgi:hypothetical protein